VQGLAEPAETVRQQVVGRGLAVGAPSPAGWRLAGAAGVPGSAQRIVGGGARRGSDQGAERGEGDDLVRVGQLGSWATGRMRSPSGAVELGRVLDVMSENKPSSGCR